MIKLSNRNEQGNGSCTLEEECVENEEREKYTRRGRWGGIGGDGVEGGG